MSDLISRKETYNELIESIDWLRERDYELYCVIGDSIRVCLDEQPAAFDVDNVIEELESEKRYGSKYDSYYEENLYRGEMFENDVNNKTIDKAIEIVKAGGENV